MIPAWWMAIGSGLGTLFGYALRGILVDRKIQRMLARQAAYYQKKGGAA